MFHLRYCCSRILFINYKNVTEAWLLKNSPNTLSKAKNVIQHRFVQKRSKSTFPPPPGAVPYEPKRIPFIDPKKEPWIRGGGLIFLLVPFLTCGLGTWQIKRLRWKTELIKKIEEGMSKDPVPLPLDPEEVVGMEFRKVVVTGTFDHENEIYYGPKACLINGEPNLNVVSRTGEGSYGYNLVTPLVVSGTGQRILVNRGWVRTKMILPNKRPWSKTEGEQTITGVVRAKEPPNLIADETTPEYNIWHVRNIDEMAKKTNCLPIYIDATVGHSIPDLLWGGQTMTKLRNEHLTYIITWYSLSIATAAMWMKKFVK